MTELALSILSLVEAWLWLAALLGAFALWCAFADEPWHLDSNLLEHRVGIGRLGRTHSYRDGELAIEARTSTRFNVPYFRLQLLSGGRRHCLSERRRGSELEQLARFIAQRTGWTLR